MERASLTRDEVCRLFQLPPTVVDLLIDSGQLLCHVRGGEQRIPIEQLETFFREGLLRLYRHEALECGREAAALAPAAEPPPPPPPVKVGLPALPPPAPEPEEEEAIDSPELRLAPRYIPRRQIGGIFNDVKFTIVQVSSTGLRIRHNDPLVPGDEAKLTFALLNPARSFMMRARVVWTSVARYESDADNNFCISGLRITEHVERLARAIEILRATHDLQPERRSKSRPGAPAETAALEGISDDEIALVMGAMQKFADDPVEAGRWYGRARFALSDQSVRRDAPPRPRDREEVLGIWEYLDRQIEIPKITGVVTWLRKARAG